MNDHSDPDIASLLTKVAAGENDAAQQCIDRYGALLWTLTRRMSSSWNNAEQAIQEIFQEIWQQADYYLPEQESEKVFVVKIARRCLIEKLKQTDWRPLPPRKTDDHGDRQRRTPPADMPEEVVRSGETLAQFPSEQQQILAWGVIYGHTYNKIAETMNLPVTTVRTQMRASLLRIREAMIATHSSIKRSSA
jgi:RNA polymerase sigma-70 factor (ECF subfamily)